MERPLDLRDLLQNPQPLPSEAAKEFILHKVHNKTWIYSEALHTTQPPENGCPHAHAEERPLTRSAIMQPEQLFIIMQMWVSARTLPSGCIAVRSWSFNPQITKLLKTWRNQLGGEYNPKYRNWIFSPHNRGEILARLQELDQS